MPMPAAIARLLDPKVRQARRQAKLTLKESRKLERRAGAEVQEGVRAEVRQGEEALRAALSQDDLAAMERHGQKLAAMLNKHYAAYKKPAWRESFESIAVAVLVALLLRSFVVEAF